jgi:hypothetical protein
MDSANLAEALGLVQSVVSVAVGIFQAQSAVYVVAALRRRGALRCYHEAPVS